MLLLIGKGEAAYNLGPSLINICTLPFPEHKYAQLDQPMNERIIWAAHKQEKQEHSDGMTLQYPALVPAGAYRPPQRCVLGNLEVGNVEFLDLFSR